MITNLFNIEFDFDNVIAESCLNNVPLLNLSWSGRCTSHDQVVRLKGHVLGDERNELWDIVPKIPGISLLLYYPVHAAPKVQIVTIGYFVFSYETRYGICGVEAFAQAPWEAFFTCFILWMDV